MTIANDSTEDSIIIGEHCCLQCSVKHTTILDPHGSPQSISSRAALFGSAGAEGFWTLSRCVWDLMPRAFLSLLLSRLLHTLCLFVSLVYLSLVFC